MARRPASGTRQRILDTACRLFDEQGVRAVGMQQVIDCTGLGKSLLYREFECKDDLVAAWMRERNRLWWEAVDRALARHDGDPARQLVAIVELACARQRSPHFRACAFNSAVVEFRDPDHPGRRAAVEHYEQFRARLHALARDAGASDPTALADGLLLVVTGVYATGTVFRPQGPPDAAVATARALVDLYCPAGGSAQR